MLQLFCTFFVHWLPLLFTERKQATEQVQPAKDISQHFQHSFLEAFFLRITQKAFLGYPVETEPFSVNLKKKKIETMCKDSSSKVFIFRVHIRVWDVHFKVR